MARRAGCWRARSAAAQQVSCAEVAKPSIHNDFPKVTSDQLPDLGFMCHEMGLDTGVDLDHLIICAFMAEEIVGHPLPGKVMKGGSLTRYRQAVAAAKS